MTHKSHYAVILDDLNDIVKQAKEIAQDAGPAFLHTYENFECVMWVTDRDMHERKMSRQEYGTLMVNAYRVLTNERTTA